MLLTLAIAGATYYIGSKLGYTKGEKDMYQRCRNADEVQRELFSHISKR